MNNSVTIGKWAFIIGLILAILAAFLSIPYTTVILLILGLIVGFLNIPTKEEVPYLVAVIALILIGIAFIEASAALGKVISVTMASLLANFVTFVSAAGLIVAIKTIVKIGQE